MVAPLERAGRKVRAPKSSVTVNGRPSKDEDTEPQRRVLDHSIYSGGTGVKRGNLYAEQDQIGPDLRVARPYCKFPFAYGMEIPRSEMRQYRDG